MPPDFKKQWPRRPPRLGRLFDTARPFYFVTFNTYKRRSFLAQPEVAATEMKNPNPQISQISQIFPNLRNRDRGNLWIKNVLYFLL